VFVFEVWRVNQFEHGIAEKERVLAVVKTEAHFVEVGREMLRRDFMPCPHNTTLEKRECGFDCISVNVAMRVLAGMVDSLVKILLHLVERPRIDSRFIRHNHFHMTADVGVDNLPHGRRFGIFGANQSEIAVALANANYHGYFALCTPSAFLASNVGFVYLNSAAKFFRSGLQHCSADSVAEVPCRFIADSERALNLAGRHSLLRFAKQDRSEKPLLKRQMCIMEDGVHGHAELVLA